MRLNVLYFFLKGCGWMKYKEIFDEYASQVRENIEYRNNLKSLKKGYISTKMISGKKYNYLQYRENGKLLSEYIKNDNLPEIRSELEKRTDIYNRIHDLDEQLNKLEAAAAILDKNLYRNLVNLRRCSKMKILTLSERQKALEFSKAMTMLEGIPTSIDTENNLSCWVNGDISFYDCFINTLLSYNLTEV